MMLMLDLTCMQMLEGICSNLDQNGDGVLSFQELRKLFDLASGDKEVGHESSQPKIL
jgi:hypothetical protein